ncbi:hypothetical protein AGDE_16632 [Angomonas deanei]|uniref:Uncharacterized protein n=1 Tax=Angomonas deanei TaxID=59799 RepID=A0A7G2C1F7_9TRYP|nr:hypothetical protein AGDE_16632 [Angomonas deanei]CAD2213598.1 hypothetical protein ADEAN_000104100 [Angomonas deanei]|eukprot:EPY16737.1 hypothetical protein AGDE_16632 [Angomonas deanei]
MGTCASQAAEKTVALSPAVPNDKASRSKQRALPVADPPKAPEAKKPEKVYKVQPAAEDDSDEGYAAPAAAAPPVRPPASPSDGQSPLRSFSDLFEQPSPVREAPTQAPKRVKPAFTKKLCTASVRSSARSDSDNSFSRQDSFNKFLADFTVEKSGGEKKKKLRETCAYDFDQYIETPPPRTKEAHCPMREEPIRGLLKSPPKAPTTQPTVHKEASPPESRNISFTEEDFNMILTSFRNNETKGSARKNSSVAQEGILLQVGNNRGSHRINSVYSSDNVSRYSLGSFNNILRDLDVGRQPNKRVTKQEVPVPQNAHSPDVSFDEEVLVYIRKTSAGSAEAPLEVDGNTMTFIQSLYSNEGADDPFGERSLLDAFDGSGYLKPQSSADLNRRSSSKRVPKVVVLDVTEKELANVEQLRRSVRSQLARQGDIHKPFYMQPNVNPVVTPKVNTRDILPSNVGRPNSILMGAQQNNSAGSRNSVNRRNSNRLGVTVPQNTFMRNANWN